MLSSGISGFAYPKLVEALGLPPRLPKMYDTGQMLAMPELDVLDALGTDVVTIVGRATNAFDEPEKWFPYDYNGRLPALVRDPSIYITEARWHHHQGQHAYAAHVGRLRRAARRPAA